jgi:Protein kinase domain
MFTLVFRIYNFLHSMRALHEKLSPQLTTALSSIMAEVENLPYVTEEHDSDDSGSSERRNPESGGSSKTGATLRNPRVQAVIQRNGYTLLPEGSIRLKPTIGKAISNYGREGALALKLLDATELKTLRRLQARSEANHTIKLLDVIELNIPPANIVRNVIVMPWQMTLAECLRENYFPNGVESLRVQFLEGVAFIHENGVAHLDLKPGNVLVHGKCGSLSPRLSIIDFGLSVLVESEETSVEGYCGTPSWVAPEVGTVHGPVMKYSAILADRWSCGQVLLYFADFLPSRSASVLGPTCAGLLRSDPKKRPPLSMVLQILRGSSPEKRSSDEETNVAQKRLRITW